MKTKRQAITITTKQLRELADKLDKDSTALKEMKIMEYKKNVTLIKWSIPIINKQPKCSDTWEFEK